MSETEDASDVRGTREAPRRWTRRRVVTLCGAVVAALVVAVLLVVFWARPGSSGPADPVAVTVPVALTRAQVPPDTRIGVIVTLGQGHSEGAEWATAGNGAVVARERLMRGGSEIELIVEDDRGTAAGSAEATRALIEREVSGIVVVSSGDHTSAGLAVAEQAGVPVVLPYAAVPEAAVPDASVPVGDRQGGVWSLAPTEEALAEQFNSALATADQVLLLDTGPGIPAAVRRDDTLRVEDGDLDALAALAAERTGADASAHGAYSGSEESATRKAENAEKTEDAERTEGVEETDGVENTEDNDGASTREAAGEPVRADAIVISGRPHAQARLVAALQERSVSVPILLAPTAVSPGFEVELAARGGVVSERLATVGAGARDASALGSDSQSRAMSAYLQALRQLADDPEALDLTGEQPFGDVAAWADARSHDAVLALALAADRAGSAARVADALPGLTLGAPDGIAAGVLDFGTPDADGAEVCVLYATGQSLGLRPPPAEGARISWFAGPESSGGG